MLYYKFLDLDYQNAATFLKNYYDANPQEFPFTWNVLDVKKILSLCPSIQEMFNPLGIHVKKITLIVCENATEDGPHKDTLHRDSTIERTRINIPVYNCEKSVTNFYKTDNEISVRCVLPNGGIFYRVDPSNCKLVDSLVLSKPAALNVHELHQVVVNTPNTVRISATIAFYENIDYLLRT